MYKRHNSDSEFEHMPRVSQKLSKQRFESDATECQTNIYNKSDLYKVVRVSGVGGSCWTSSRSNQRRHRPHRYLLDSNPY